jgi:hypothetical protein
VAFPGRGGWGWVSPLAAHPCLLRASHPDGFPLGSGCFSVLWSGFRPGEGTPVRGRGQVSLEGILFASLKTGEGDLLISTAVATSAANKRAGRNATQLLGGGSQRGRGRRRRGPSGSQAAGKITACRPSLGRGVSCSVPVSTGLRRPQERTPGRQTGFCLRSKS